jgi:hypothetical protein
MRRLTQGQVADFALEFFTHGLRQVEKQKPRAKWLEEDKYKIAAEVVHSGHDSVLDFGIRAYREDRTSARKGSTVEGEIYLGIDPFFYFEFLNKNPLMPALIYRWRIDMILMISVPMVEGEDPYGKRALVRDETRKRSEVVSQTDAWGDKWNGEGPEYIEYILDCTMTNAKTRRVRRLGV